MNTLHMNNPVELVHVSFPPEIRVCPRTKPGGGLIFRSNNAVVWQANLAAHVSVTGMCKALEATRYTVCPQVPKKAGSAVRFVATNYSDQRTIRILKNEQVFMWVMYVT